MLGAAIKIWPLFLGIGFIMLGNGLQGTLLGLRAEGVGFATGTTGVVMAGYYVGFLFGSLFIPRVLRSVGHIRVFAALASLASVSVLLHYIVLEPAAWWFFRVATGTAYSGLYIVAESWLNDYATNRTRGQLLSVYMVVTMLGISGGQLLLNVADPTGPDLFILISVLVSLALIPVSLKVQPVPVFDTPRKISFRELFRVTPLGVAGTFGCGLVMGSFFSLGAVYATRIGLSIAELSLFMMLIYLGGMVLQWPVGWLSDRFDRRKVITVVTMLAAVMAAFLIVLPVENRLVLMTVGFLYGSAAMPLYSLCVAYTNDHLKPEQMVAGSSTLMFVQGVGAILGPMVTSGLMIVSGATGFGLSLAVMHALIGLYAIYRMTRRPALPHDEQGHYVIMPPRASPVSSTITWQALAEHADPVAPADDPGNGAGVRP